MVRYLDSFTHSHFAVASTEIDLGTRSQLRLQITENIKDNPDAIKSRVDREREIEEIEGLRGQMNSPLSPMRSSLMR